MANGKASFFFFKYALVLLNIFFFVVGIILVAVAAAAKASSQFSSLSILGGIIASGVFLILVAVLGLIGAIKHHQVALFFYMVCLGILFLILFSVSIAALALNESQRHSLLESAWNTSNSQTKQEIQHFFNCCAFDNIDRARNGSANFCTQNVSKAMTPACAKSTECGKLSNHHYNDTVSCCDTCYEAWQNKIEKRLRIGGGVGLFFSFVEVAGLVFTYYYRNRKDPSVNPRAFL